MEREESFDLLFENWDCKNTGLILPLARRCLSLSPSEREVLRALEVTLCFCLKNFTPDEFESEVFRVASPAVSKFILEKLQHIQKNPRGCVESLDVSVKVISYLEEVFEYLSEFKKISINKVRSFLTAVADVLFHCFSHCKTSSEIYGSFFTSFADCLSNFFKKCCCLQKQFLNFLTERLECDVEDMEEVSALSKIMTSVSKSGFLLISLEIKTMAEVWKAFVFLVEKFLTCLKDNYNIRETIKELCCNITSNVDAVICSDSQDFGKIIKLSCFLLKLVIKFCEMFVGCLKSSHSSLLNLLLKFYKWDVAVANKSNQDLISQLTIGTEPLLSQLMMDKDFVVECFILSQDGEKAAEFAILCCSIMKKLLDGSAIMRSLWFDKNNNTLEWILASASTSQFITCTNICLPSILVSGKQKKFVDLYEYVLVTTSAFLMTATADEYQLAEETLIKSVLQMNPMRALLAIDIWCLLARFADSELCFSQMVTLTKVFQEFHSGTFRVEKWYLASLIQRLFPLLAESHRMAFLKTFQPSLYPSFWEGSKLNGLTSNEACDVCETLLAQVDHLMDGADGTYSKMIIPTWREGVMHEKFGGKILKLWKFNCEILSSTPQSVRFLKIACALTGCIISEIKSVDLLMVLTQMKTLLTIGQPTSTKLYFTWILNSLSTVRIPPGDLQKKIIVTTAEIFKNLLSSKEVLVKQKAFEVFYSFAHRTCHGEVISMSVQNSPELKVEITNYLKRKPLDQGDFVFTDYVSELCQLKYRHICPRVELDQTVMFKKIKLDIPPDLPDVVFKWKENGKKIVESFHLLSEPQKREIQTLCNSMLSLLQ